jgi:hypothetical protein
LNTRAAPPESRNMLATWSVRFACDLRNTCMAALHFTNAFIVSPSCCETASPLLRRIDAIW